MDRTGKVANPARGQLKKENEYFPVRVRDCEFGLISDKDWTRGRGFQPVWLSILLVVSRIGKMFFFSVVDDMLYFAITYIYSRNT